MHCVVVLRRTLLSSHQQDSQALAASMRHPRGMGRRRRIEFETDLFKGCVVVWVGGLSSAPPGLFKGQRRRTSIAVQVCLGSAAACGRVHRVCLA